VVQTLKLFKKNTIQCRYTVLEVELVDYAVYFTLNTSVQLLGKSVNQLRYGFLVSSRRNYTPSLDDRQKKIRKGQKVQKI